MWTAAILLCLTLWPAAAQRQNPDRVRPPEQITCPRDQLTAYIGRVTAYHREPARTSLTIRTDWDTTERVEITHPGTDDPSRWFLLRGRPFSEKDWPQIESARGQLKPELRASAWVCDDGRNAIVDWNVPAAVPY